MKPDPDFELQRSYLTQLAYRMLGTVAEAEDMVQEAYLKWLSAGQPELRNARAWFTRVCTRLCLDRMRSSQRTRENYTGEWLPEPLQPTTHDSREELDESLSMALLATMQKLKPAERAAFLLHDVFDYEFTDIAEMLELQPAHCRQLASRARQSLRSGPVRYSADRESVERVSGAFFQALGTGDLGSLRAVLSDDVVLRSDGGGKASAARHPIHGLEKVLRFFDRIFISARNPAPVHAHHTWLNGGPSTLLLDEGQVVSAFQLQVVNDRVQSIHVQRNPDKLAGLQTGA
ncbi:MAG: RNA polymerase sigma factor SigJ [Planctomycetota bacterium]|nr:RNA polymerase sigma factor SigJ [Planctomycetota bacterium]